MWWRKVPVDLVAFFVIALGVVGTHAPYLRHGMAFNDPTWFLHFGNRVVHGDVPYRDFVFQVGPLPLYVDAAFQRVAGETFIASTYAAMLILILRVLVVFMLGRRLAGVRTAAALAVFCMLDPLFAVAHHWSTAYEELFLSTAGLMFVLAQRATGRRELVYLALAGASAGLVMTARQSGGVLIGLVLGVSTTVMVVRGIYFTRRRFVALWAGYAAAILLFVVALAAVGALGPAIQQMFLDAPAKKSVSGIASVADALTGGSVHDWRHSAFGGFFVFLGIPIATVAGVLYVAERGPRELALGTLAMLIVPAALVVGLLERYGSAGATEDLPRTLLSALVLLALVAPERLERWFGVSPLYVVGIGGLALASDWALEMSAVGRGWGDSSSTIAAVCLLALASTRAPLRAKTAVMIALALGALLYVGLAIHEQRNPFVASESVPGSLQLSRSAPMLHGTRHPMLKHTRLQRTRAKIAVWLAAQVEPGSTCFLYGNLPVLYDLLRCTNPTKLDTTAADFMTVGDAERALATLRANPPDYLVAQESQWMSPSLEVAVERYDGLNPAASRAMHLGLRALLSQYESVGIASEVLTPDELEQSKIFWDALAPTRVYRRKP